jgi:hypothetical protein
LELNDVTVAEQNTNAMKLPNAQFCVILQNNLCFATIIAADRQKENEERKRSYEIFFSICFSFLENRLNFLGSDFAF